MDEEETSNNPETTRTRTRSVLAEIPISHDRLGQTSDYHRLSTSDLQNGLILDNIIFYFIEL